MIDKIRCEVLNANYEPLSIITAKRALVLFLKGKADILREHNSLTISTEVDVYPLPVQIRLIHMVRGRPSTRVPAQLSQKNLFIRDKYTCQYCGRRRSELKSKEFLTRDHVHPQDKGGLSIWQNLVTACNRCNNKKANLTLEELKRSGMEMSFINPQWKPYAPSVFEIYAKSLSMKYKNHD